MVTIAPGLFRTARVSKEGPKKSTGNSTWVGNLCVERRLPLNKEYTAVPHFRNFPEGPWWHSRRRLGAIIAQISRVYETSDVGIPRRRELRSTLLYAAPQVKY